MTTTDQRCPSAFHYWHGSLVGEACNSCGASWKHDDLQETPKPEARTWKDDIAKELRERLDSFRYAASLRPHHSRLLGEHLLPWILEVVEHACALERVEDGRLP